MRSRRGKPQEKVHQLDGEKRGRNAMKKEETSAIKLIQGSKMEIFLQTMHTLFEIDRREKASAR
ncbi:MAG: hypothetical protein A2Z14_10215 [Chloroflexi bacterium RBG_16_48_8]|nr:MAG: hypothetical protein A2Z14_10215 [Chloroflexi bacterium RBG_16_48_8]